jgi:hypothetical protein
VRNIPVETSHLQTEFDTVRNGQYSQGKEQEIGRSADREGVELFSVILRWIWEKNRNEHEFFIEESFPISWTYDYAIPHD